MRFLKLVFCLFACSAVLLAQQAQQQSLGDVARKLRKNGPTTSKRVLTNDDIASPSVSEPPLPTPSKPDFLEQMKANVRTTEEMLRVLERMDNEVRLGNAAIGEHAYFPGRDAWEYRLLAQHKQVVRASRAALDVAHEVVLAWESGNRSRIDNALALAKDRRAELALERFRYDQLVEEGKKAAAKWQSGQ